MKQIALTQISPLWTILFILVSSSLCQAQYPFVTPCKSSKPIPSSGSEMAVAKAERLFQGSAMFPEGKSSSLIIQPEIVLDSLGLPPESENGRPVTVNGMITFHILSPGDMQHLGLVEAPFFGKGMSGEMALREAIQDLEVDPSSIQAAYDKAYHTQEVRWNDCETFLQGCRTQAESGHHPTALVMLGSIPPGTPCSRDVQDLWAVLMKDKKSSRCKDLMAAAKVALKEQDDHRCLQLAIAADPDCQASAWKKILEGLAERIPITERADRRMLERALEGALREDERNGMLYAILFEQIMSPQ
ncbi:MAG: hypothetical protein K9I85_01155 [Saprospiraceae bacterium]|nr:hypothetical protein [Saprospiraceae bacterium]